MFRYFVRRLLQMVLTFFGATFVVYALMFANQDDPLQALAGERPITESQRLVLTERYHLNEPFIVQYGYYMKGLLQLDFGTSLTGREISDIMLQAWPVTVKLATSGPGAPSATVASETERFVRVSLSRIVTSAWLVKLTAGVAEVMLTWKVSSGSTSVSPRMAMVRTSVVVPGLKISVPLTGS